MAKKRAGRRQASGRPDNRILALWLLLVAGMAVSSYLLVLHLGGGDIGVCTIGSSLDCDLVNKSPYANVDGILYYLAIDRGWNIGYPDFPGMGIVLNTLTSNAFLGFLALSFLLFLTTAHWKGKDFLWVERGTAPRWVRGILIFGVAYGGYLLWVQHSLIGSYCLFCLTLDAILVASLVVAWRLD